ncbi:MAG: DHA2 family efflux MFS transporter permease subunit [Pseudonocardiaceae bacterium]|nr:DHA2 family efflux MFS transporter permease subunit [Pseudonocardiaceae bacterium]
MSHIDGERDSRWFALLVLCAGMLMIILDGTIVNVALPVIQLDLGFSQSGLAWVINAYLIPFGGLLLLAGRAGDLIGRKRMFLAGLAVFTVASLLCGLATSQEMLIGARFIQGIGGAMAASVILGMIVTMFPERAEQAKAIGVFSFVAAAGGSIGLLAGGALTEAISWHWIFFVNVPIGIVAFALAVRSVPAERGIGLREGADVLGAILVTSGLMLAVYTIVKAADYGWASAHTLLVGAVAVVLLAGFVLRQAKVANPLLPLRILRNRNVAGANIVQVLMIAGMFGMFFLGALYLERVLGYDPLRIGLGFLPVAVGIGALSLGASARANARFGERPVLIVALVLMAAGLALFTRAPVDASYFVDVFPPVTLLGVGAGLAFPAIMTLAMSGATEEDSGVASGLVNTMQQMGGALGLAVLATLATSHTNELLARGEPTVEAMTSGYRLAFGVGAVLVAVAVVLAATLLRQPKPATDELEPVGATSSPRSAAPVVELPCGPDTRFQPTVAMLENAGPLDGVVVASPANPTGTVLPAGELAAIAGWCAERGVQLVSDETYHGIAYGADQPGSAWQFSREAIVVNSFSKYFTMTGWRLGWLLVPHRLHRSVDCLTGNFTLCPPTLSQHAATAAFQYAELDAHVARYRDNRDRLVAGLRGMGVDRIAPVDGAFYAYADVSHLTTDTMAWCQRLLAETGLAIVPGIDFDPEQGHRFIRLSFAGPGRDIETALERLGNWLAP